MSDFKDIPFQYLELKPKKKYSHIEDDNQKMLFERIAWELPDVAEIAFAIPNGGKRNAREAARLKCQGVKAGVPDIFVPMGRKGFCGLFIEMKGPIVKGKPIPRTSVLQLQMHVKLIAEGFRVCTCYGADEAFNVIKEYVK